MTAIKYNIALLVGLTGAYYLLWVQFNCCPRNKVKSSGNTTEDFRNEYFLQFPKNINSSSPLNLWRQLQNYVTEDRILKQFEWIRNFSLSVNDSTNFREKRILVIKQNQPNININSLSCPGFTMDLCDIKFATVQSLPSSEQLEKFDAVLLYDLRTNLSQTLLKRLPENLQTIIYSKENPLRVFNNLRQTNAIVASYNPHSDIVVPYSKWIPKNTYKNFAGHHKDHNFTSDKVITVAADLNQPSSKMAVIFTSNCKGTNNNRLGYIKELGKYMSVDIFGNCGKKIVCGRTRVPDRRCMGKIIKQYKFYLSFENANCRNYITEKVFSNAFSNDIVPVVLGAHPDDYKNVLPFHSYILAEDFNSPEELARYLILLHNNNELYKNYFAWKGTGDFYNLGSPGYLLCRSCGMLFYANVVKPPKWTEESYALWKNENTCLPKNVWYWNNITS